MAENKKTPDRLELNENGTIRFEDYLKSLLSEEDIKKLENAREMGLPVYLRSDHNPSGLTTLTKVLNSRGYNAIELEVTTYALIELKEPISWLIPLMEKRVI